ncbi:hypothetical protein B9Z55_026790 [Caenorhabditis nigoni]|uniref:BTB domain-containing protein n=2 Tax=Caenorhabditis nigoni TaxID=1611254 RepID=A0A2G5SHW3_9PELO|nr:hypothetical protein B9Z55_026790 [Caenorhabditis nigoni]
MSERFKYSHNGICTIPNVPETIAADRNVPSIFLFEMNDFRGMIYLAVRSDRKMIYPVAYLLGHNPPESTRIPAPAPIFLKILIKNPNFMNKNRIKVFAEGKSPLFGPEIPFLDVLNLKNGFLDENGAMTIEYGFHFDSIFDEYQEIWKFNLKCEVFDGESKKNMITYEKGKKKLFSHKQLILFHDSHSKIYNETQETDTLKLPLYFIGMKHFENFLHIAHGVQLKHDSSDLWSVIVIAHRYGFQNVLAYCERQLVMDFEEENYTDEFIPIQYAMRAIKFNLYRLLAVSLELVLKNLEKWDIDTDYLFKSLNWGEMTNESRKIVMANVLYGEY